MKMSSKTYNVFRFWAYILLLGSVPFLGGFFSARAAKIISPSAGFSILWLAGTAVVYVSLTLFLHDLFMKSKRKELFEFLDKEQRSFEEEHKKTLNILNI